MSVTTYADLRAALDRWCEIDLSKLTANFAVVRGFLPPQVAIMAVVKADGYGYGMVECARTFAAAGADMLAVTTLDEGIMLRGAGINTPTLVFSPLLPQQAPLFARYNLTATVCDLTSQAALSAAAAGKSLDYHVKLNTGMNRMGVGLEQAVALADAAKNYSNLRLSGVYSHLATAGGSLAEARQQLAKFRAINEAIKQTGVAPYVEHLAASSGLLRLPEARFGMVRAGSILYGQLPSAAQFGLSLADPWCLKARIVAVQNVERGAGIGYGFDSHARAKLQLGVVPLGYCDGIGVAAQTRTHTLVGALRAMAQMAIGRGKYFAYTAQGTALPFIGRIAMQSSIINITGQNLAVGDILTLRPRRALVAYQVPRVYLAAGQVVAHRDAYEGITSLAENQ